MFRRLMIPFASTFALILTVIGTANVSSFKFFILYEPDVPKALEK
ncbi:hypothetical protein ASZ90_019455 [hydrocarbon metagenome]|uniref:Cyclic lactone autoinducer peptide n=1 Tax=hydrocarbon metagenome TaxID=938273 RepID=A0A0W8E3E9_9ZZZZ